LLAASRGVTVERGVGSPDVFPLLPLLLPLLLSFAVEIASAPPDGPTARAESESQNTVTIPRAVRRIKVPVITAEVLSGRRGAGGAGDGMRFGVAAIGRSINTT
jgi:hypothetical protein